MLSLLHFSPLPCSMKAFCTAKRDFNSKCFPIFSLTHYSNINPVNSVELDFKHAEDSIIILKACLCTWAWLITCCLPENPGIVDIFFSGYQLKINLYNIRVVDTEKTFLSASQAANLWATCDSVLHIFILQLTVFVYMKEKGKIPFHKLHFFIQIQCFLFNITKMFY